MSHPDIMGLVDLVDLVHALTLRVEKLEAEAAVLKEKLCAHVTHESIHAASRFHHLRMYTDILHNPRDHMYKIIDAVFRERAVYVPTFAAWRMWHEEGEDMWVDVLLTTNKPMSSLVMSAACQPPPSLILDYTHTPLDKDQFAYKFYSETSLFNPEYSKAWNDHDGDGDGDDDNDVIEFWADTMTGVNAYMTHDRFTKSVNYTDYADAQNELIGRIFKNKELAALQG